MLGNSKLGWLKTPVFCQMFQDLRNFFFFSDVPIVLWSQMNECCGHLTKHIPLILIWLLPQFRFIFDAPVLSLPRTFCYTQFLSSIRLSGSVFVTGLSYCWILKSVLMLEPMPENNQTCETLMELFHLINQFFFTP